MFAIIVLEIDSEIKSSLGDIFFLNYSSILYGVAVWVLFVLT